MKKILRIILIIVGGFFVFTGVVNLFSYKRMPDHPGMMLFVSGLFIVSGGFILYKQFTKKTEASAATGQMVCSQCGYQGETISITKGSMGWEIVFWLLFIVPGIFYSVWRIASRYRGCPKCKGSAMIPADSPMAKKILNT